MLLKNLSATLLVTLSLAVTAQATEEYGNLLGCDTLDLTSGNEKGQSFLEFIRTSVKPHLDNYATEGYEIVDGDRLVEVLDLVDSKVRRQALGSVKGSGTSEKIKNLKRIGDELEGKIGTVYTTHDLLAGTGYVKDRFKLSTYVGLASCAGSHLKLADDNYAYNVHYGTGDRDKDDRTGRSFGASRKFNATDSSYTHYLKQLEIFITETPDNTQDFNTTVMETLTNTEPRRYDSVNDQGDAVLTDLFAIWIAEQTRNIMDGTVRPHWDAALLQTTLLSASFHAGQNKITMFYRDPLTDELYFTDATYELAWPRKNHQAETCEVDLESRRVKDASLTDYIGVHYRTYKHCGRSGVNMSRKEWRKLGKEITAYLERSDDGRKLLENVRKYLGSTRLEGDIFREIAKFLINDKTPTKIKSWSTLSKNTAKLLEYVRDNANEITEEISAKYDSKLR